MSDSNTGAFLQRKLSKREFWKIIDPQFTTARRSGSAHIHNDLLPNNYMYLSELILFSRIFIYNWTLIREIRENFELKFFSLYGISLLYLME